MAHLLNGEGLTIGFGDRLLLDGVSLGVDDGDRIGVVGRNGDGKSTLLRVLARSQPVDAGRVTHRRGLRLSLVAQADDLDPGADVRGAVVGELPEHRWAADSAVRNVLTGLLGGLDAPDVGGLATPVGQLSGGQRRRVALARALVGHRDPGGTAQPEDVLLLDEPTNHLDVESIAWLAQHLRTRWPSGRGALIVVTHDRWFLDAVSTRTWEVHDGAVDSYDGGYAAYVLTRAERARVAAVTAERRANLLRKELAWLRRGAPARTSKPRFRLDAAAALIADEPAPRDTVALQRLATARLGKDVLDLEGVTLARGRLADGSPRVLLDDVTWRLGPGDRIGVVGVNGSGKTSLLKLLTGELAPDAGRVRRGKTVRTALLSQDVSELAEVDHLRVQEAVERVRSVVQIGGRELGAGHLLEQLGFTRQRIWTPVAELSGGERRRLQLLRLLMGEPNVLLLDEPTNDLDTDTLAAVEDTLDGWPGTLVVVSHDRYLLERISDRQIALLGDGSIRDLPGGVDQYLALRAGLPGSELAAGRAPAGGQATAAGRAPAGSRAPADRSGSGAARGPGGASAAEIRAARKELARIERQLERLAQTEQRLHAELSEHATDHEAVLRLDAELRDVVEQRAQLEEQWLGHYEIIEGA